jgi:hypothetical protein
VARTIRGMYLPPVVDPILNHDAKVVAVPERNTNEQAPVGAYPAVQPLQAALYFPSAATFGEWRILISTQAERDLRKARREDGKMFEIYAKKIR